MRWRATIRRRGPFAEPFLLLAVAGKADALVTGDPDPPSLAGQLPCPIRTAEAFPQTLRFVPAT